MIVYSAYLLATVVLVACSFAHQHGIYKNLMLSVVVSGECNGREKRRGRRTQKLKKKTSAS